MQAGCASEWKKLSIYKVSRLEQTRKHTRCPSSLLSSSTAHQNFTLHYTICFVQQSCTESIKCFP